MRKHLITLAVLLTTATAAHAGRRDGWIGRFFHDLLSLFQ